MKKKSTPPSSFPPPATTGLEALAWAVSTGSAENVVRQLHARARRRQRRAATLAGATLTLLVLGFVLSLPRTAPAPAIPSSATISAPAKQILPDGSTVELKPGAAIAVDFAGAFRRVALTSGEAHFQIANNPSRPFIVSAAGIEVRAVGTAFSVDLGARAVEVVVTEGRVAVNQSPPPAAPATKAVPLAVVDAGNRVIVDIKSSSVAPAPAVQPISPTQLNARMAWRVPRLQFSGTSLSEAIPLFNEQGGVHLTLEPALGKLQLSGVLRADDVDSLLLLLKNEFGIEPERRPGGVIFLRRR